MKPNKTNKTNTTPITADAQQENPNETSKTVIKLKNRGSLDYDVDQIDNFLDLVFHAELVDDENIIGWSAKSNTPAFPKHIDKVVDSLCRTKLAKAVYFGTSTVHPHPEDGKLYNRKDLFKRLHVVVLDDIGTKIPKASLPPELVPNYIIETSENNFQYGYVLAEPLEDYDLAEGLIHAVYTSGLSDSGGKMPTKVVRMPCGINGKKGDKGDFRVRLVESNTDYWTPEDLLAVMDIGVTWEQIKEDGTALKRGKSARAAGTSIWSPIQAQAAGVSGIVDPVLEWLYDENLVANDNGKWVQIRCPWESEHTDSPYAGYSPIGRSTDEYGNRRGFHCFHDHCSGRSTHDFLEHVSAVAGISVPVVDNVADLVAKYAYVSSEDAAYKIQGVEVPMPMKMAAFKNTFPHKVEVFDNDGKAKFIARHALWLNAPNRLVLDGIMSDPADQSLIVDRDNCRYLNKFNPPNWGSGEYDQNDIDTFKQFLEYLIPHEFERDYFLQWLAAKVQNITFKGAAILMVAPMQGTGRTTLTDMMATLFNQANVSKLSFSALTKGTEAGAFNEWQESVLVTCDEVMSPSQGRHAVYESLKDIFDPRPKTITINPKYGMQRKSTSYTSYLMLTNHEDAIGHLGEDRRVFVISNTLIPAKPEYFTKLNAWLEIKNSVGQAKWAGSVWRWLETWNPDIEMLHAPAPSTQGKLTMISETSSINDAIYNAIESIFGGYIPTGVMDGLVMDVAMELQLPQPQENAVVVKRIATKKTSKMGDSRVRIDNKQTRVRLAKKVLHGDGIAQITDRIAESYLNKFLASGVVDKFDSRQELIKEIVTHIEENS